MVYLVHHTWDEFVSDRVANRNDERIDGMEEGEAQCNQTHLLPAQHPAVQPIREAPSTWQKENCLVSYIYQQDQKNTWMIKHLCFRSLTCIWFLCRAAGRQRWHRAGNTETAWWVTRWETPERWRTVLKSRLCIEGITKKVSGCVGFGSLYLVGQRYHNSVGDILLLFHVCIDDISNEQVEEEEGSQADGHTQRQPPLWEQPQGKVLNFSGCRQRTFIQDCKSQLGGHICCCPLRLRTVPTQKHLEKNPEK